MTTVKDDEDRASAPMLKVTISDGRGNVTEEFEVEAPTATQNEIDDAVALIHGGCDARTAMMLAKQGRPPTKDGTWNAEYERGFNEAIEAAAKLVFDELCDAQRPYRTAVAHRMSAKVRALKHPTQEQEAGR